MKNLMIKIIVGVIFASLTSCGHYSLHESKKLARKKKKAFKKLEKSNYSSTDYNYSKQNQ